MKEHMQESQRAGGLGRVSYLLLQAPTVPVTLVMKRVRAGIMQRQQESREGARKIKANREGNPRGLAVHALRSGAETQRDELSTCSSRTV